MGPDDEPHFANLAAQLKLNRMKSIKKRGDSVESIQNTSLENARNLQPKQDLLIEKNRAKLQTSATSGESLLRELYRESKVNKKKVMNWRRALHRSLTKLLTNEVEKAITNGTFLPRKINGKTPDMRELAAMMKGMTKSEIV